MAFRALVSGDRGGPAAAGQRILLWLLKWPYHAAVAARNLGYRSGALPSHRAAVPVISIGNLTTGGTGKTPLVAWLANHLADTGHSVGLLSRGYRGNRGDRGDRGNPGEADEGGNDEKKLLESLCPTVPHVQDPDRVAAASQAVTRHGCDVLLLDDGFQHRRLVRDLDIVLVDATCPFGFGHLLPRGLLREPPASLKRASLLVLTRIDEVDSADASRLRHQLETCFGTDAIAEVAFPASGLVNSRGTTAPLQLLAQSRVAAFCGIGNPEAFRARLDPVAHRDFPDHHCYDDGDLAELAEWANRHRADLLLTTRKDLVKIPHDQLGQTPLWAIDITVEWISGQDVLQEAVAEVLDRPSPSGD